MLLNMLTKSKKKSKKAGYATPERFQTLNYCKVSRASNEIMLDRFYDGKGIEFPFLLQKSNYNRGYFAGTKIKMRLFITIFNFINYKNC